MCRRTLIASTLSLLAAPCMAALDTTDPSLIVLYQLNEQSSGALNNSVPNSFEDSASTGGLINHDSFGDGVTYNPAWGSGAAFTSGGDPVGTGTGLVLTKSEQDHSRSAPWQNVTQGAYQDGGSYTLMVRLFANGVGDDQNQNIFGTTSNYLQLRGISGGAQGRVQLRVREGGDGGESSFFHDSLGSTGASTAAGGNFTIQWNKWYNVFLIYNANTSVTVAIDDGTTFQYLQTNDIGLPAASFDSIANGFSDSDRRMGIGTLAPGNPSTETFDGLIESIAIFDRALTPVEADAINLTNTPIPEPATVGILGAAGALVMLRRARRD